MRTFLRHYLVLSLMPLWFSIPAQSQPAQAVVPAIIVLDVSDGQLKYARPGWLNPQPLLPGDVINVTDYVYADFPRNAVDAVVTVLCPDGSLHNYTPSQLPSNQPIACPQISTSSMIIGNPGLTSLSVQRSGLQLLTIPFLIQPRATAVRHQTVQLVWNDPGDVDHYTITVRGGMDIVWASGELQPEAVVFGEVNQTTLPIELQENIHYSVEICVAFTDLREGCTTDSGWGNDTNITFQYVSDSRIAQIEALLVSELDPDSPEAAYARAVLLRQPILVSGQSIGYYAEAIELLEQVLAENPDSPLAQSPRLHYELGELYRLISLPRSAALQFEQALSMATSEMRPDASNEIAALAAVGLAQTTPNDAQIVSLYNQALDYFSGFMDSTTYEIQFQHVCALTGDLCAELQRSSRD